MLQQAGGSLGVDVDDSGEQDGRVQQVHEGAVVAALPAVRAEVVLEVGPLGAPVRENPFGHEGHDGEDDEGHHGEPRHHGAQRRHHPLEEGRHRRHQRSITSVGSNGGTTRGSSTALQLCHRDHQLSSHLISSEGQQGATGQGLHLSSLPPPPPSRLPTAPETRPCDLWQKFDAQRKTNVKKRRDHPQTKTAAQHEVSACRTRAQTIRSYSPEDKEA